MPGLLCCLARYIPKIRFIVTRGALRFLKIHLWFAFTGLFAGFPRFRLRGVRISAHVISLNIANPNVILGHGVRGAENEPSQILNQQTPVVRSMTCAKSARMNGLRSTGYSLSSSTLPDTRTTLTSGRICLTFSARS
jgi:hypothetical protein